jgi:glucose/arabinose dehydrogenase
MKPLSIIILLLLAAFAAGQTRLVPQKIALKNGKSITLNVADGFEITPAVEGLKRVRFFAKAPDGRVFVTDMYNLTDNKRGVIYILDGWNESSGKFEKVSTYLTGLHNPNSVQFYRDAAGQDWIYIAETEKLTRRKFTRGETRPTDDNPQTLATFPDYGLSYKYGGWHLTRTIAFSPNGKLYVSVGSSCNSCIEKEAVRASVLEMDPDGSNQREIAKGLRNAVGLKWIGNFLFATNQGSDHLGTQKPDETFYALTSASGTDLKDYGWPYCHSSNGKIFADPKLKRPEGCRNVTPPYAFFPARSSALGFDLFDDADATPAIKNAFLVSLHGSTNRSIGHGYKIVVMRKGERLVDFINGFLQNGKVLGRPCDILKLDANSFLFTDDHSGIVYYVHRTGSTTKLPAPQAEAPRASPSNAETAPATPDSSGRSCLSVVLIMGLALVKTVI